MPNTIIDCSPRCTSWLPFVVVPLALVVVAYAPESWEFENGVLENAQMLLLLSSIILCFTSKFNQAFFRFIAAIVFLLMLREVNCGRALLWSSSGEMFHCGPPQDYLKWKHIPHGALFRFAAYGVGFGLCLLSLCNRATIRQFVALLRAPRIPLWETLLLISGVAIGVIAEKVFNNGLVEELGEILIYSAIAALIYLYSRKIHPSSPNYPK